MYAGGLEAVHKPAQQTLFWIDEFGEPEEDELPDAMGNFTMVQCWAFITEPDTPDEMGLLNCQHRAAQLTSMLYRSRFSASSYEGCTRVSAQPLMREPEAGIYIYLASWQDIVDVEVETIVDPVGVPLQRLHFVGDITASTNWGGAP